MLKKRFLTSLVAVLLLAIAPAVVPGATQLPEAQAATVGLGQPCEQQVTSTTGVSATLDGNDCVVTFTSVGSNSWTAPTGVNSINAVIVGGGGGGGAWTGAGGGAGGVVAYGDVFQTLSATSTFPVTAETSYNVTVGDGGNGAIFSGTSASNFTEGENGDPSTFGDLVAYGGGVGASWSDTIPQQFANGGSSEIGSGGGATDSSHGENVVGTGNSDSFTAVGGRGKDGGKSTFSQGQPHPAGGGGGAGEDGKNPPDANTSGAGGDGVQISITGSAVWVAGGGGGGIHGTDGNVPGGGVGAGGQGGGGAGSGPQRVDWTGSNVGDEPIGESGADNTGGGGGGAGHNSGDSAHRSQGGKGGSGIVIVRYSLNPGAPTSLSAAGVDGGITVNYSDPTYTGGGTLSFEYQILLASDNSTVKDWTDLGETDGTTTVTPAEISNGTAYTVKLRAKNTRGGSSFYSTAETVGDVIPGPVGEILRLDATHPEYDDATGSGKEWNDQAGTLDGDAQGSPTYNTRTKAFDFDSGDYFDLPETSIDFSNGLAIHATADFGDDVNNWERLVEFGNGAVDYNIWFGRYWNTADFAFEIYRDSDGDGNGDNPSDYCRSDQDDDSTQGIQPGIHTYSVVISASGECTLYVDGVEQDEQIGRDTSWDDTQASNQDGKDFRPPAVVRSSNFIAKSNWGEYFEGSIQSVVMYNTDQTTPECYPIEDTFTGNGTIGESSVSYKTLAFTTGGKCQWDVPTGVTSVAYLVVAGGGGGAGGQASTHGGGGGGAGGLLQGTTSPSGTVTLSVGLGGNGGVTPSSSGFPGESGGDSSLGAITATGGGGGGTYFNGAPSTGGSGGGGGVSATEVNRQGASGTAGQGNSGGSVSREGIEAEAAAGGGGAGDPGEDAVDRDTGGAGGAGLSVTIAGSATYYAGGGGGGGDDTGGAGGNGGGGAGGNFSSGSAGATGNAGYANTGGGGGGGTGTGGTTAKPGGDGGSGIVIVRYSLGPSAPTISSVSSGDGSIDVAFTAPSHTGGVAITDYEYSFDGSTWTSLGTASAGTETISELTNGTAYTVRLRAVNGNNGESVTAGSATTPRGSQTLTWTPTNTTVDVTDGSVTLAPAASALGGVTIQYSVPDGTDPSCGIADNSTPTVTFSAIGDCVVTATALQEGAFLAATTTVTLSVVKAAQTITFAAVGDKTYGDSAFALTVSSNSGLTVTVTPADTSVCTVASTTVTIVSVGTCSLTATQAGDDSEYDAATDVTRSFNVAAKPITMSVAISDKTYDGVSAASVSGTPSLTGVEAGDTSDVAVDTDEISAEFADPDAGSGKSVTVTLGDDVLTGDRADRYTVTVSNSPTAAISKANQSSLAITSANSMVYGQSIPVVAVGGSSSGDLSYSKVSGPCTVSGSTVTSTGAGSCVVSAAREADTNYNSVSSADFTITVSKANQSINFTSTVPVSAVSGTTYTPTATASSGLTVSFDIAAPGKDSVCSISGSTVTFLSSGTCVIIAAQSGDTDYNAASSVTQTIEAGKINQTISFPSITGKDFDAPAFAAGATVSSGRTVTYATSTGSVCAVSASTGVVSIKTIGDCTVTASSSGDASYAAASDVSRTFTISPVLAGKPSITSASFGDSSVTVGFVAPGSNGGDAVDGYQLVATSSGGSVTKPDCSTTSPCTITGLTNGEAYTVTIAAINAAGVGPASSASPSVTPATVADAVSGLATTPGDEELQVTWTALTPGQLGGGDFTQYDLYLRVNGGSWGSAVTPDGTNNLGTRTTNSYTFTGLTNGTAYDVKVVAITEANSTQLSSNTSTALGVPATVPDAPTGLVLSTLSNTQALASWAAPADDGGDAVSAYDVNISCTFVNATDTFCTLTGLTAGSRVTVSVGATNLMGTGATVSAVISMPGGSSGSSESSESSGGSSTTPTVTPSPPTVSPIVPRGRLPLPAQATPNPRLLDGPIVQPGNRPDVNGPPRARIGGVPAAVTTEASGTSNVGVRAGVLQLNISVPDGAGGGVSENTSTGLPELMVPTGQSTRVAGGGLLPGSSLQVWLPNTAGAPRELARIPVMQDGSFDSDVSFTSRQGEMPLPVGRQLVQVAGYDENGNQTVVDMTINIGQGPPQPETNRQTESLPQLTSGQTLATSAGMPEQVRIEVRPEERQVAVLSGDWSFEVTVEEETGAVADDAGALAVRLVQEKTADVSGSGFQPDSRVDVWLFSDPTLLGSVTVSADGSFTTQFYLDPRYATPGEHTLQLQGVASDGYIKAANVGVEIVEPAAPTTATTSMTLLWIALAGVVLVVILILAVAMRRRASARR